VLDQSHGALGQPRRKKAADEVVAALRAAYIGA